MQPFMSVEDYLRRKVERARKEQGITFKFMAAAMGLSEHMFNRFRRGENREGLDVDQAEQLYIALGGQPFIPKKERLETWHSSSRLNDINSVTRKQARKKRKALRKREAQP